MKTKLGLVSGAAVMVILAMAQSGLGDAGYADGGTHDISATVSGGVYVSNATTVNTRPGARITGWSGEFFGDAGFSVRGGSTANIYGGTITGGNFSDGLVGYDSSSLKVYGGEINGGPGGNGISLHSNSTLDVYGGRMQGSGIGYSIHAVPGTKVRIFGGDLASGIYAWTGTGSTPVFEVFGSGFNYGQGPINVLSGTLSGTLADGTIFSWPFKQVTRGEIVLSTVPEPGTILLLACGAMAVRRVKVRRR